MWLLVHEYKLNWIYIYRGRMWRLVREGYTEIYCFNFRAPYNSTENTTNETERHQGSSIFALIRFVFGESVFRWVWHETIAANSTRSAEWNRHRVYVPLWSVDYLAAIIACSNPSFDSQMNMICILDVMLTSFFLALSSFYFPFLRRSVKAIFDGESRCGAAARWKKTTTSKISSVSFSGMEWMGRPSDFESESCVGKTAL